MTHTTNDTLLLDDPDVRPTPFPAQPEDADRLADMTRIVRRVLRNPGSNSPLSQAIRTALANVKLAGAVSTSDDEALRIRQVALGMDALLSRHATAPPSQLPHLETVRY